MPRAASPPHGRLSPSPEGGTRPRGSWLAIALAAVLLTVVGTAVTVRQRAEARRVIADTATLGGLTVEPHDAGWLAMDGHNMDDQGGFQMPAQMMPGAPVGDDMRLGVPLTLMNTSQDTRPFNLVDEFFLGGGRNETTRSLHSDSFGALSRLAPGNAVNGILYFDTEVPGPADPPLYLIWKRDGDQVRLAVPLENQPEHEQHGS